MIGLCGMYMYGLPAGTWPAGLWPPCWHMYMYMYVHVRHMHVVCWVSSDRATSVLVLCVAQLA